MFSDQTRNKRIRPARQYQGILPAYYSPGRYGSMMGNVQRWFYNQPKPAGLEGSPGFGPAADPNSDIARGRYEVGANGQLQDMWAPPSATIEPVRAPISPVFVPFPDDRRLPPGATGEQTRPTPTPTVLPTTPTTPTPSTYAPVTGDRAIKTPTQQPAPQVIPSVNVDTTPVIAPAPSTYAPVTGDKAVKVPTGTTYTAVPRGKK